MKKITLLLLLAVSIFGKTLLTEEILAVVGSEPILLTEVEMAIVMDAGVLPDDDLEYQKVVRSKLNAIIDEKLLYEAAIRESLVVDEDYLDKAFNERWDEMRKGFATDELFKDALRQGGHNIPEFKTQMRVNLRKALTKQRFIQSLITNVDITPSNIEKFFKEFKDSLPEKPAMIRLSVLVLHKDLSQTNHALVSIANEIRDGLQSSFQEEGKKIEAKYPELEVTFGELGTFNKGDLSHSLDSAAFTLEIDEISSPIPSQAGVHILKRVAGGGMVLEHITISGEVVDASDSFKEMGDDLYSRLIASPDSFQTFVELFSDDKETKDGDLGYFEIEKMDTELRTRLVNAKAGDILSPLYEKNEIDIFRISEMMEKGPITIENDYDTLTELARQNRISEIVQEYLVRIRKDVFIDIRIDN